MGVITLRIKKLPNDHVSIISHVCPSLTCTLVKSFEVSCRSGGTIIALLLNERDTVPDPMENQSNSDDNDFGLCLWLDTVHFAGRLLEMHKKKAGNGRVTGSFGQNSISTVNLSGGQPVGQMDDRHDPHE